MKIIYYIVLVLTILTVSCDTKQESAVESDETLIETKDSAKPEAVKPKEIKLEAIKKSCEIYKEDDFRKEFTCLYFEKTFTYSEYVKQANFADDCDKFYSDLKIKNDFICENYRCSEEELRDHCIDLFSYEDDTLDKHHSCVEHKCSRNKFKSNCNGYKDLCIETVILACLNKSGLASTDFNIRSCAVNNKSLIQRVCTTEACITNEVNECSEVKCKLKPSKEYLEQCAEKEKDICTTQARVRFF